MVRLRELLDIRVLQGLMENFCSLVNVAMAIVDTNGDVLVSAGFKDICLKFHRTNPITAQNCFESDVYLSSLSYEDEFKPYRCKNGMWDVAAPIIINGEKLGSLFIGQFFFIDEEVDESTFIQMAKKCGFDEADYLDALHQVPRWDRTKLTHAMRFTSILARQITDMAFANFELKASEERYKALFLSNHSVMLLINPANGLIYDANPAACLFYGWSHDEIINLHISKINTLPPEGIAERMKLARAGLRNSFEFIHRKAYGELCDVEVYSGTIFIEGKELLYSIVHDVSSRNKAYRELEKSRENLRLAQRIGKIGSWEWNILSGQLFCSDEIYNIFGIHPSSPIADSDTLLQYVHPNDREHYLFSVNRNLSTGISSPFEYRIIRPDGQIRNIFADGHFVLNEEGRVIRGVGIVQDITDRITVERKLFESEFKFKSIVETSPNAIIISNMEGVIEYANDQAVDILKVRNIFGLLERSVFDFVNIESIGFAKESFKDLLEGRFKGPVNVILDDANRHSFYSEINAVVLHDSENSPTSILFVARDITEQLNYQSELRDKNVELQKSLLEKDRFFSIIAHDLKSPFNGFLGLTQLMSEKKSNLSVDEMGKLVDVLKNAASNLYQLLDNLLEWSRTKQGLVKPNLVLIDIVSLTKEAIAIHQTQAKNKSISIVLNLPDRAHALADAHMFRTILRNLISNAIKFTPAGGRVELFTTEDASVINLSISDSGLGIPDESIHDLFNLTSQFRRKGTDNEPSTGLGLILCQELALKQNGAISVHSEVGRGSTFTLTLRKEG